MNLATIICDGCNVRAPHEHRCHGENASVSGEATGKRCQCRECNPYGGMTNAVVLAEYREVILRNYPNTYMTPELSHIQDEILRRMK